MTPLVSIVIPAFNAAPWITAAMQSAMAQSHPRCEVIVVEDGSTDGTLAKARAIRSSAVRVVSQANAGAAAARNHGLRLARGDFIQFLDADDLLAPDKIQHQLERLQQCPPMTLASSRWGRFTLSVEDAVWPDEAVYPAISGVEFLQLHYETGSMMQPAAWLTPRELIDRAGPWDGSLTLNDDGEFFARVMLAARQLIHVPAARCYYRATAGSLSRRRDRSSLTSLHRSVDLTTQHLLQADESARTRAAVAYAWKWTAYELYPAAADLADDALRRSHTLGGSRRPFPGSRTFRWLARVVGWKLARRMTLAPT